MPAVAKVTLISDLFTPDIEGAKFSIEEITKVFQSFVGNGFVETAKNLEEDEHKNTIFNGKVLDFDGNLETVSVFIVSALEKHLWKLSASLLESPNMRFNLELTVLLEEGETFMLQTRVVAYSVYDHVLVNNATEKHFKTSVFLGDLVSQLNITSFLKDPKSKQAFKRPALSLVK